jgi:hypothetical protein
VFSKLGAIQKEISELANIHPNNISKVARTYVDKFMKATFETVSRNTTTGEDEF